MTMTDNTCNGWRNAATWTVNLWFGDNFAEFTDAIGTTITAEDCREAVETYVESVLGEDHQHGFIWDMLDLNSVDWEELARHHADMMEELP